MPTELVDTSVWARRRHPQIAPWFERALRTQRVGTCDPVVFELLHSARTGVEMRQLRDNLGALPHHSLGRGAWTRVLDVYQRLAEIAPQHHRSVGFADMLIAVSAEEAGWTLVHYDKDFDLIAEVTGQPARWVVRQGSI